MDILHFKNQIQALIHQNLVSVGKLYTCQIPNYMKSFKNEDISNVTLNLVNANSARPTFKSRHEKISYNPSQHNQHMSHVRSHHVDFSPTKDVVTGCDPKPPLCEPEGGARDTLNQ